MAALILAFPAYRAGEPGRRKAARESLRAERVALGKHLFELHCAGCHGEAGRGGRTAPTLAAKEFLSKVSDDQLRWLVALGIPGTNMPAYDIDHGGPLTDQEIGQLVTYMRSWEDDAPSVPNWRDGVRAQPPEAEDGSESGEGGGGARAESASGGGDGSGETKTGAGGPTDGRDGDLQAQAVDQAGPPTRADGGADGEPNAGTEATAAAGPEETRGERKGGSNGPGASRPAGDRENGDPAHGSEANGSEANGSEANGSEANGSEANGSEANGSEANGSEANGSEAKGGGSLQPDRKMVRTVYATHCAACHGPEGAGTAIAGRVRPPPEPLDVDRSRLVEVIDGGRPGTSMRGFGKGHGGPLDRQTIEALARWLQAGS
jgi:mono/diheme cytochrome c family protein